jgi:predicted nuclease of predicted toxin-antitoxin system
MVRKEIVQNDNTDISIEVIKHDNDLVELSISYGNTPFSIMLDRDDVNALIDELAFTKYKSN